MRDYTTGPSIYETDPSGIHLTPASDLALAIQTGIPYAAGEAARRMIRDWAQSTGLELLQGYEDAKYPVTRWDTRGEPYHPAYSDGAHRLACRGNCGGGCPPGMNAIAPVPPDAVIVDCDTFGQCQIAYLDLPPHFSTRGTGGCKHYFHHDGGLPRIIRALGRPLDFLGNPDGQELWVKVWGPGYELLTWHPDAAVLPVSLLELHAAAVADAEEMRSRLGSVPVEQYLEEGIESGQQSSELWRSACSLAACGHDELEIRKLLAEIVDISELTKGPWRDRTLDSMARRAVKKFGRPAAPKQTLRSIRERMAEKAAGHSPAAEGHVPGELSEAERQEHEGRMAEAFGQAPEAQDVSAGQDGVCGSGEEKDLSHKQSADLQGCAEPWQPCVPLTAPADLKAKWTAELDDHKLSRDWDQRGGRRAQDYYGWVMQQLIAGIEVQREKIQDQIWEHLSRKSPNGAILLSEGEDGQVTAWSDPEPDSAEEPRDPWPGYPGCPADRNPQAGGYIGRERGEQSVKAAWAAQGGERAKAKMLARWINTHRADTGMETPEDPLGCRYMGTENARRITRELYERGELKRTKDEEHYRRMHTWRTLPAAYVVAEDPVPTLGYRIRQAFGEGPRSPRRTERRHRRRGRPQPPLAASSPPEGGRK